MLNLEDDQVALATMAPEDMRVVHELRLARHSVLQRCRGSRLGRTRFDNRREGCRVQGSTFAHRSSCGRTPSDDLGAFHPPLEAHGIAPINPPRYTHLAWTSTPESPFVAPLPGQPMPTANAPSVT